MARNLLFLLLFICFVCCKPSLKLHIAKSIPAEIYIKDTHGLILLIGETNKEAKLYPQDQPPMIGPIYKQYENYVTILSKAFTEETIFKTATYHSTDRTEIESMSREDLSFGKKLMVKFQANALVLITNHSKGIRLAKLEKMKFTDGNKIWMAHFNLFYNTDAVVMNANGVFKKSIYLEKPHSVFSVPPNTMPALPKDAVSKAEFESIAYENAKKLALMFTEKQVIETTSGPKSIFTEIEK